MPCPPQRATNLLLLAGILVAAAMVGIWVQPAGVNGDGVGYLKQLRGQGLSPGHLLYLPLARALTGGAAAGTLLEAVPVLRGLSLVSALLTLLFLWDSARRVMGHRRAILTVALLASSHAFMRAALEVEVYAPAALLCVVTLWALIRGTAGGLRWAALAGAAAGVAAGFHGTLILLAPSLILAPRRDHRAVGAITACLVAGLVAGATLFWAATVQEFTSMAELWRWLRSADHGVPYPHGLRTVPATLWGLIRSLVHAPYAYQAPLWWVGLATTLAAAAWASMILLSRQQATESPSAPRAKGLSRLVLAWTVPMALFALAFFPSDTERWIFALPALFLVLTPRPTKASWALVALIAALNIGTYQLPLKLDDVAPVRAAAAEKILQSGDLLISPGHGWEELVGLGTRHPPELFPLIHFVGAEGGPGQAVVLMWRRIVETHAAGGRVYVARLKGSTDPNGFKELAWFQVTPDDFASMFDLHQPEPSGAEELWRLRSLPTNSGADPAAW